MCVFLYYRLSNEKHEEEASNQYTCINFFFRFYNLNEIKIIHNTVIFFFASSQYLMPWLLWLKKYSFSKCLLEYSTCLRFYTYIGLGVFEFFFTYVQQWKCSSLRSCTDKKNRFCVFWIQYLLLTIKIFMVLNDVKI